MCQEAVVGKTGQVEEAAHVGGPSEEKARGGKKGKKTRNGYQVLGGGG